jgi:hypothetical protein
LKADAVSKCHLQLDLAQCIGRHFWTRRDSRQACFGRTHV